MRSCLVFTPCRLPLDERDDGGGALLAAPFMLAARQSDSFVTFTPQVPLPSVADLSVKKTRAGALRDKECAIDTAEAETA
jgi:hypothetical protein